MLTTRPRVRPAIAASAVLALCLSLGATLSPAQAARRPHAKTPARPHATAHAAPAPLLSTGTVLFVDGHRIGATGHLRRAYISGRKVSVAGLPAGQVQVNPVLRYQGYVAAPTTPEEPTPSPASATPEAPAGEEPTSPQEPSSPPEPTVPTETADPAVEAAKAEAARADAADGDTDIDSAYLLEADTVMLDQVNGRPLYRMWLRSGRNIGYRESSDGVHWHIHDPDSVIIVTGVTGASVMKDPASGLYYLMGWSRHQHHYVEMVSRDGINFEHTSDFSGVLSRLGGDVVQANSDPSTGRLIALAKQRTNNGKVCRATPQARSGGRTFGTSVSARPSQVDILNLARSWADPRMTLTADCTDVLSVPPVKGTVHPAHLYGMPFARYGDQFIGLPWFFQVTKLPPAANQSGFTDGPVDTQIASTPDPARYAWSRSEPVVRVGLRMKRPTLISRGGRGSWDDGMLYGQTDFVALGDRVGVYYTGWNSTHAPVKGRIARIGLATWRKDGFVGLKVVNPHQRGWLRTRAFRLPPTAGGRTLHVNAALGRGQNLRVAVLDGRTLKVLPGFRAGDSTVVRGDQLSKRVTWHGGRRLGVLRGRSIRLLFSYGAGSLYSFKVV